ncbi:MAG: transcription termination factor Rho [Syntrophales bacterium]|nr:transcription termination factor Rho [Syntrophales bacterium]
MAKKERKEKKEKPLDKMTATELRKYALDLGEIVGVHGMNKEELLAAIKEVKGIKDEGKATAKVSMRELKEQAREMRVQKQEAKAAGEPRKKIGILRKKANRLKKRTRRAA